MARYRYRAATSAGEVRSGAIEATSLPDALRGLQRQGLRPIVAEVDAGGPPRTRQGRTQLRIARPISELAVLAGSGLPLDRALGIVVENAGDGALGTALGRLQRQVKEGVPLSRAIADEGAAFPPLAAPMVAAGEANGALGPALARLADALGRGEALRKAVVSAMIYPALLVLIACAVILMMLLFVVPQFENLFGDAGDRLPAMTKAVVGLSHAVRDNGLVAMLVLVVLGFAARLWLARPAVRRALDRRLLALPRVGPLLRSIEAARFARVLGSLAGGGVPLPQAMALAQRTIANSHMADAVARVSTDLKRGGGLSRPLAETGMFPRLAISFIRTGEETASLGPMLDRLADVLDDDIRVALDRLVAVLTPLITVVMGIVVATVIASIMTAVLGFNDLALGTSP